MKKIITLSWGIIFSLNAFAQGPPWQWASSAGSQGVDVSNSIAVDASGNSYITGRFTDAATFGPFSMISVGGPDVFVAKYSPAGTCLWVKKGGGVIATDPYSDQGYGIDVDVAGNCYVTGTFLSAATFGPFNLVSSGAREIFVAKYDINGNELWVKTPSGGLNNNEAKGIVTDTFANCYITGSLGSGINIFGSDTLQGAGTFIAKYDSSGSVIWATKIGMSGNTQGYCIDLDPWGNSYISGYLTGTENFGSFSLTSTGLSDVFVAKIDASGNLLWAQRFGATLGGMAYDYGISTDAQGNIFLAGFFDNNLVFGSTVLWASSSMEEAYISKLDSGGTPLWAGTSVSMFGLARSYCIKAYPNGSSVLAGYYIDSVNFCSLALPNIGDQGFVIKYDAAGNCMWSKYTTGLFSGTSPTGITIDNAGDIYVTGYDKSPPTFDTITPPFYGGEDLFIAKLSGEAPTATFDELNFPSEILLFPNPVTNEFTIYDPPAGRAGVPCTISSVEVYNAFGQNILSLQPTANSQQLFIDVSKLGPGIYFLKLKSDGREHVAKFIKQ